MTLREDIIDQLRMYYRVSTAQGLLQDDCAAQILTKVKEHLETKLLSPEQITEIIEHNEDKPFPMRQMVRDGAQAQLESCTKSLEE